MRSAKDFFQPMALGAPAPEREIPLVPSRMIHFFDPSNPKMAAKVPDLAKKCDVVLGNLEEGRPLVAHVERKGKWSYLTLRP